MPVVLSDERMTVKQYTLADLPPLVKGRSGLQAVPRAMPVPCVRVPATVNALCADHGFQTGLYTLTENRWHFMPGLGTHFALRADQVCDLTKPEPTGERETAIFHIVGHGYFRDTLDALQRAFWAGLGHAVTPMSARRQQPAIVVGQVAAEPEIFGHLGVDGGWRMLRSGDFILHEGDGSNVRVLDREATSWEFSKLVEPVDGQVVVDFNASPSDPTIAAY